MRGVHTIGGNDSEFSKERLASEKRTVPMLDWKEDRKPSCRATSETSRSIVED
jgi:hypothetical protein